jgi:K+-transporting ATPase ATPase C chain
MKDIVASFRMLLWMTLLTGGIYPLVCAGISRPIFHDQADGSLVTVNGNVVGSSLIAQNFSGTMYFWPRPSAAGNGYDPTSSGGSNLGPTSAALLKAVQARQLALSTSNPGQGEVPQDLLFASGSGLDPHISPAAAKYQVARVAAARKWDPAKLQALVDQQTEAPTFGVLGEPRINVLKLNLALDAAK